MRGSRGRSRNRDDDPSETSEVVARYAPTARILHEIPRSEMFDVVVVDRRESSRELAWELRRLGTLVGIDAAGSGRPYMSYLVDLLPRAFDRDAPNLFEPGFLAQGTGTARPDGGRSVLVSFGGEDPARLSERILRRRVASGLAQATSLKIVKGPRFGSDRLALSELPDGVEVVESPTGISDLIARSSLVITSFGLTAFEARATGVACILINPSKYHEILAQKAGFPCAGVGKPRTKRLRRLIEDWSAGRPVRGPAPATGRFSEPITWVGPARLSEMILTLAAHDGGGCPVCRLAANRVVRRFEDRSYFRCRRCGMLYMESFASARMSYTREYFFEAYERQYGKTYLDDFAHIRDLAADRLRTIERYGGPGKLLDIGCAYGPFLAEAHSRGYDPHGVDISEDAVDYVRNQLGITADAASIMDYETDIRFSVATLWYVIEHFPDVGALLARVNGLLVRGGRLAFSTPSGSGISGRKNLTEFLRRSPADHYTIWEPSRTRQILSRFGFELRKIRITGHHPERFFRSPANQATLASAVKNAENYTGSRTMLNICSFASRLFRLGDTFEAYAVKVREIR